MDMAQAGINMNKNVYTSKLYLNLLKKLVKQCILNIRVALHDAEIWTLRKVNEKYLEGGAVEGE
jgi:hypothetical protein